MIVPVILMVIGVVFFAQALGFIQQETLNVLWPLLLIVVGLGMLTNRMFGSCCDDGSCWACQMGWSERARKKTKGKKRK